MNRETYVGRRWDVGMEVKDTQNYLTKEEGWCFGLMSHARRCLTADLLVGILSSTALMVGFLVGHIQYKLGTLKAP